MTQSWTRSNTARGERSSRCHCLMKASGGSSDDRVSYTPSKPGEFVADKLAGIATLASGRFAMIDDGLGFQFVPWQ
ncbi:DUF3363 domain-containing protein [Bradyrhizobium sp. sBnM-33]|uniref:DUF3363 domain-containing protein n=1 Tax=Bradyrhizobium sp. sBnM-33 TaxID=2831780 RepID=UPI001BCFC6D1|nr:DUF3363 domain-containing protein [Bradyrhizobium sp. sBnM-33]WOH52864.1 DUF3363 domain-containing protein [Bradyrhizobium sp. sBnM-33]